MSVLDTYRTLTDEEKDRFRAACIEGINATTSCPLCRRERIKAEGGYRYNHDTLDWEPSGIVSVACLCCKVRWTVKTKATP